jgi:hypothetical protein
VIARLEGGWALRRLADPAKQTAKPPRWIQPSDLQKQEKGNTGQTRREKKKRPWASWCTEMAGGGRRPWACHGCGRRETSETRSERVRNERRSDVVAKRTLAALAWLLSVHRVPWTVYRGSWPVVVDRVWCVRVWLGRERDKTHVPSTSLFGWFPPTGEWPTQGLACLLALCGAAKRAPASTVSLGGLLAHIRSPAFLGMRRLLRLWTS